MTARNYTTLIQTLKQEYRQHSPRSAQLQTQAGQVLVDGGSHSLRLIDPFPPRVRTAAGAYVVDEDEHQILDFWQGHYANVLGHNPAAVTKVMAEMFSKGQGLQTGFVEQNQAELAKMLCAQTGAERMRFTTSGTLSTMYAILLARAFTGREMVMKVGGGWHGAHLWGLKGVHHHAGFEQVDSVGVPSELAKDVIVTNFNDSARLEEDFRENSNQLACFIVEPVIGAGGMLPAEKEYLQTARQLCDKYGVVLIFDEVVSGFRYRAGDVGTLYGIRPDLVTMGKVIGGGMPVAAVGGKAAIMDQVSRAGGQKVKFSGGTYSGHPASMAGARAMVAYLIEHEDEVYPRLAKLGRVTRARVMDVFEEAGVLARFAGESNEVLPDNSLCMLVFPRRDDCNLNSPDDILNPEVCDIPLGDEVFKLAMLLEDVHIVHGLGALSTAHTLADIDRLCEAYRQSLKRIMV